MNRICSGSGDSSVSLKVSARLFRYVVALSVAAFLLLCQPSVLLQADGEALIGKEQQKALESSLVGEWIADVGKAKLRLELTAKGRFALNAMKGDYTVEGNTLKFRSEESEVGYQCSVTANELDLSGGDLAQPLKFTRVREPGSYLKQLFASPRESARGQVSRILVVLVVAMACRLLVSLLRGLARVLILSEWGPLRFFYQHHKNRAMTMHSLALNLAKYLIYLTAIGFILTELGINYTTYLASLSVIGLAIAFGSQGLVQDMVTGFFIIFEGQFDVGDMVEIPPNTGIVEELGLRMTKLRNYLGQLVVIPNRNIATVGTYATGAQEAYVDVAITGPEAAKGAMNSLRQFGREVAQQFPGVILGTPEVSGPVSLATGEHFVRLHVSIWPQQQWVIDGQMIPRIREGLKRAGFEVPGDQVSVFYHERKRHPAPALHRVFKKSEKRPQAVQKTESEAQGR